MNTTHTKLSQIIKSDGAIDAHLWIEHDGKVIDYTDEALSRRSRYGTLNIVRKEFDMKLQKKVLRNEYKRYEGYLEAKKYCGIIMNPERVGNCTFKAMLYKEDNPTATIKAGSLGFIQKNGDIFYEWG